MFGTIEHSPAKKGGLSEKAFWRNVLLCVFCSGFCEKSIIIVRIQIKLDIILGSGYNGFIELSPIVITCMIWRLEGRGLRLNGLQSF